MKNRFYTLFGVLWLATSSVASTELGISFPPVANEEHLRFTTSKLNELNIDLIRIAEDWSKRPAQVTAKDFSGLKYRIQYLQSKNIKVLLTVQSKGPNSECKINSNHACVFANNNNFKSYLNVLLDEVGGDLDAIQFGNEPDQYYPGTAKQYLDSNEIFYSTVRQKLPQLQIMLGGITGRAPLSAILCDNQAQLTGSSSEILEANMEKLKTEFCVEQSHVNSRAQNFVTTILKSASYDVIDVHLYDHPDYWKRQVNWVKQNSRNAPIWATEFGGPTPNIEPTSPEYQATRIPIYMNAIVGSGVKRAYYFKLTDDNNSNHSNSGLFTIKGVEKPSFEAFKRARTNW